MLSEVVRWPRTYTWPWRGGHTLGIGIVTRTLAMRFLHARHLGGVDSVSGEAKRSDRALPRA